MKNNNNTTPEIHVGDNYKQGDTTLRALANHNGFALMEQWSNEGVLIQYIVTHGLFIDDDGELHWNGSGAYLTCRYPGICDTPYNALRKALDYMQGPLTVYVFLADTTEGVFASVHSTIEKAEAVLQRSLDYNHHIQSAAADAGIDHFTADMYLKRTLQDYNFINDFYSIEQHTMDNYD